MTAEHNGYSGCEGDEGKGSTWLSWHHTSLNMAKGELYPNTQEYNMGWKNYGTSAQTKRETDKQQQRGDILIDGLVLYKVNCSR